MRSVFVFAGVLSIAASAGHAEECFTSVDIEADQAILYQTELMVVSDICRNDAYVSFLSRNTDAIRYFQKQMITHFARGGSSDAVGDLDTYTTRLANQTMLRYGGAPTASLCREKQTFMLTGGRYLDEPTLRQWAASQARANVGKYRICPAP
ncbi:MAG TPA: hypothetical protein VGD08_20085 [Stellaceae bacterium]|jgi:hypothetical protein